MPRKKKRLGGWTTRDKKFLQIIKEKKGLFLAHAKIAGNTELWSDIEHQVNWSDSYCRRKWYTIRDRYLKIKKMIRNGRVTEDMVKNNQKTWKYLDGTLDFIDDSLDLDGSDGFLPASVHQFFDSIFGGKSIHNDRQLQKKNVIDSNSIEGFEEIVHSSIHQESPESNSILPTIEDFDSDCSSTDNSVGLDNLESSMMVDDSIKIEEHELNYEEPAEVSTLSDETIQLENETIGSSVDVNIQTNDVDERVPEVFTPRKRKRRRRKGEQCTLAEFFVNYSSTKLHNFDVKAYMKDLADVLCTRLTPSKRAFFLKNVDLIVSKILEER